MDTHLGGTSVVELDGTLGKLGLFIKGVPAKVKGAVTEVTNEFVAGSLNVLHDTKLKGTNEGNNLGEASSGNGIRSADGSQTVREGVEGATRVVNISTEVDSVAGHNLSKEGKLADTAVLDLDVTETVETFLVGIVEHAEGIEKSEWGLGTEFGLEGTIDMVLALFFFFVILPWITTDQLEKHCLNPSLSQLLPPNSNTTAGRE